MKLLRVGTKGNERPAILDKNGKIRELSSQIKDLNPDNLNFETILKLKNIDLEKLPEFSSSTDRIGPCVKKPGKFVAIGLNYSDHAAETGAKVPTEPIVFMKATSCINGPNDDIELFIKLKKIRLGSRIGNCYWKRNKKHFGKGRSKPHSRILPCK